ncbi:TOMM precursor leader peptide-binding protein [Paenibacillus filicis]|uniref:TOMM leader peptide-binding protein n=1 Tax=Paenibacillus gyeongsangnamensis TaxID=3388067 RepID=A0ABT4Q4P7_9BACL|nr:TOMM precursor leader peptide-binding protein [Paenibacillus filicis]MCZ8511839.1 TOMM precursor leader peptide-binding protein [Paenibacillus filicis]
MNTIVIVGEGMLADTVCKHLTGYRVIRRPDFSEGLPAAELVLALQDHASSSFQLQAEEMLRNQGIPWLFACVSHGEGVVGPLVRPGTAGCSQCAELRRSMAGRGRKEMDDLLLRLAQPDYPGPHPCAELPYAGLRHMATILSEETAKVLRGGRAHSEGRVYLVDLDHLNTTIHYILPDPTCQVCGRLPDDSAEAAEITLRPCKKLGPNSYRSRSMSDLRKVLAGDYWDSRTGLFNGKQPDLVSAFAGAVANLPLSTSDEVTGGRSHSYADSELAAILEGLERNCGLAPRGKRTVVYDSFSRLKLSAMDPSKVGFHAKEQLEQPDFPFLPFDPDTPMAWVWGYSFLQERPVLVPELLAYYSLGYGGGFVYETSNGCAIGGSLEEAILYGIMEVAERDSFLMTWYARLPVPRLDYRSSGDLELLLMTERLRAVTGYEVSLYNTTMGNGIPSIWAVAKNGMEQGANLVCAAGAHLDPIRAAKSALHELAGMIPMVQESWRERREDGEAMLHDSFLVQHMGDHSLLYSLPQAEERLRFLLDEDRPLRTFAEEFRSVPANDDLTEDLKQVLQVFRSLQLEVIVIDQSSGETLRNGLHCVKVLIPGMLPMTFGHQLTRLAGLDRVLEVPMKLGYANHRLTPEELNPYPHPFP